METRRVNAVVERLLTPKIHPWVRRAARLGDLAIGSVYIMLGAFAFAATFNASVRTVGFQGALHRMLEERAGVGFLMAIGLGLVADGFWQSLRAAYNADMANPGWRGYLDRGSWMISGLIHLVLGIFATKLAVGIDQNSHESELRRWTQIIMPMQFGAWLIMVAGIVTITIGIVFVHHAARGDIGRWLDLSSLVRPARAFVMALGRFGIAARGAVFIVGGALVFLAAVHVNPGEAHGLGGVLRTIQSQQYGRFLLAPVALGLIAYGLFEFVCARYRRFRIPLEEG